MTHALKDIQERLRLESYKKKYYHMKYELEELREVMLKLTNKINELSDELEIVQEMFGDSLRFKSNLERRNN